VKLRTALQIKRFFISDSFAMKRAKLSKPKSTDRGGGILKYVRRSPAEYKTGNRLALNFIYQTGCNQQPFQFNTHEVAETS